MEAQVRRYLKSRFPGYRDDLRLDDRLDGAVDSLGVFDLVEWAESTFKIRIPNEEFSPRRFDSIGSIVRTIQQFR